MGTAGIKNPAVAVGDGDVGGLGVGGDEGGEELLDAGNLVERNPQGHLGADLVRHDVADGGGFFGERRGQRVAEYPHRTP